MDLKKRALCAVMALVTLLCLVGCSNNGPKAVVATVDGVEIYKWEIDYYFSQRESYYQSYGESLGFDPINNPDDKKTVYQSILETFIEDVAMTLYAKEQGYGLTDAEIAEVDAEFARKREESIASYAPQFDGDLKKAEEAYLKDIADSNLTEEFMLESQYNTKVRRKFSDDMYAGISIDEETILDYYNSDLEADKASYTARPDLYEKDNASDSFTVMYHPANYHRFKQILIAMPADVTEELNGLYSKLTNANTELSILSLQKGDDDSSVVRLKEQIAQLLSDIETTRANGLAQIREKAESVQSLVNDGGDFDELIAEYGEDEGMKSAPYRDYGYFVSDETTDLVPAIKEAALALSSVGDTTTELVSSDYGYHILELVQIIEKGPRPLEEVRDFITSIFKQSKQAPLFEETAEKALEGREIVRYTDRL